MPRNLQVNLTIDRKKLPSVIIGSNLFKQVFVRLKMDGMDLMSKVYY